MRNSKAIFAATLGTVLEWAEFTFFAYMADQLSAHFFTLEDPNLARLKTYGIFATSYFMRPLGAFIFGNLGDKIGRKPALIYAMVLMGIATTAIGALPTFQQIGSMAALLLICFRMLQGLAVAGEFHGAITYLHELAEKRPFLMGAMGPFSAAGGMCLGALAASLTLLPGAPEWAWRLPFLASGLLCLLGLYLRLNAIETPEFSKILETKPKAYLPLLSALKNNKRAVLSSAAVAVFIAVFVYVGNVFYKITSIKIGGLSGALATEIVTFGQFLSAILILFCGYLGDKIGGRKLCLSGLALAVILAPLMMLCAQSGSFHWTVFGQVLYAILNGLVSSSMMTLLLSQFDTHNRYSGSSFGWSISAAIFGGTSLIVAETLVQLGFLNGPGLYISFAALVAFLGLKFGQKKVHRPLHSKTQVIELQNPLFNPNVV